MGPATINPAIQRGFQPAPMPVSRETTGEAYGVARETTGEVYGLAQENRSPFTIQAVAQSQENYGSVQRQQSDLLARALPGVRPPAGPVVPSNPEFPIAKQLGKDNESTIRTMLANGFTLGCMLAFAAPTLITFQLGMDVDATYWIGRWGLLAVGIPIFILIQHAYHLWMIGHKNRMRRYIFIVVPVVPAVFYMVLGLTYFSVARHMYGQLKSADCDANASNTFGPAKALLQASYEEARTAYGQCLTRMQEENLGTPLQRHVTLQQCQEWDQMVYDEPVAVTPFKGYKTSKGKIRVPAHSTLQEKRWQYLANVELTHLCGGFCTPGQPLFANYDSTGRYGGSCSQFVAHRMLTIMHWGQVIFTIGTAILVLSIVIYLNSRTLLTNIGYKSGITIA